MISRNYVACHTCDHVHVLRIQVGYAERQEHTFNCANCNEPIRIEFNIDNTERTFELVPLENCVHSQKADGTILYLSSEFVANKEDINSECYFPSFQIISDLAKSENAAKYFREVTPGMHLPPPEPLDRIWTYLQKSWRLSNAGQYQIANRIIVKHENQKGLPSGTLSEKQWHFLNRLFQPPHEIREELELAFKKNRTEFERFIHYYFVNLRPHHRRSQLEILSEYFDSYQQHSQVQIYVRESIPLRAAAHATSIDFNKVNGFYAKSYEFFAGAISILTCINNIIQGRPFDRLQRISLSDYLTTDKAKRLDSFSSNHKLSGFIKEFDSSLRNASYHNWFFLRDDNTTIEYRTGGTGAVRSLSYTEYLYRCGLLFKQICQLFTFELELDNIANEIARQNLRAD